MRCVAALYAASRILVAICRERLLPPAIAWVWEKTLTPVWCTLITGIICGAPRPCYPRSFPFPTATTSRPYFDLCTSLSDSATCSLTWDCFLSWCTTATCCACAAIIALLTDFVTLADLVSLGTLAVFLLVACALVYRRYDAPPHISGMCGVT